MQDTRLEVANQVLTVVDGLSICAEKTRDEMISDLLTLTLARLKVDWIGSRVENSDQNEELAEKEIKKISHHLNEHHWETESQEDLFIGKFFEEAVTRKGFYGIFEHTKSMGLIFAEKIGKELTELLKVKTVEKRQQFAWIAPYFTPVRRMIFKKGDDKIELILPSK